LEPLKKYSITLFLLLLLSCKIYSSSLPEVTRQNTSALALSPITNELSSVNPSDLRITEGHIIKYSSTGFSIRDTMRGELWHPSRDIVEIDFVYLGPSDKVEPFASGEIRRQIGLKLRAQNTCNVIYVMWYVYPTQGIHVSVKSNPGNINQCGDGGYIGINPSLNKSPTIIQIGQKHYLRASIIGTQLQVLADGLLVWAGELPKEAFYFNGPVGLRSDNSNFDVELKN
jgi:hypothetical protein